MFMSITHFSKLVTVSIWMFNNLLLNKIHGMLPCYYKYTEIEITVGYWLNPTKDFEI